MRDRASRCRLTSGLPLTREIVAYQKHRSKRLRRLIPRMNRYPREEGAYGPHDGRVVLSKARAIDQLRHGDA